MARFTEIVTVANRLDGPIHEWEMCEPFSYRIVNEDDSEVVNVAPGFTTDFASIPRPLWWWVAPWGRHGRAAIVHDFLYQRGAITDVSKQKLRRPSRLESDRIFREAMAVLDQVVLGRSRWGRYRPVFAVRMFFAFLRRWLMWLAVVLFGHWAYDRKQAEGTSPELEHRMLVSVAEAMEAGEIDLTAQSARQATG